MRPTVLALRIWFLSSVILDGGLLIFFCIFYIRDWYIFIVAFLAILICSTPVIIVMILSLPLLKRLRGSYISKIKWIILICGLCAIAYGIFVALIYASDSYTQSGSWITDTLKSGVYTAGILFVTSLITLFCSKEQLENYFGNSKQTFITYNQSTMETFNNEPTIPESRNNSNKILIKGSITAGLILLMMIPTAFISDLVRERELRNETVVKEVDSRWAASQTLSGPYIYLPFNTTVTDPEGKTLIKNSHLIIIPENKQVSANISHEFRERSIYKVLLYRASVSDQGDFTLNIPKEIKPDQVQWSDAMVCYSLSDFKGIEEKLIVRFNGTDKELSPGLPGDDYNKKGLSAPILLSSADLGKSLNYRTNIKIRGSEQLHFVPLSGNSHFTLSSTWPSPSFDGSNVPLERTVNKDGFSATWNFNKANLPFGTVLSDFKFDLSTLAFGVTMVEPADQYAKTNRSIKYAILIIGLTFSLFFIIELMQRKPIHPVQYVLIGLALIIFYSLLLAISEFISFDYAYLIAASATIGLIGLYAKSHFKSWKSAGIFAGVITLLYGFIFVLIRLEDTALLVGSIGLFIILALTMYASKKVNWYGHDETIVLL